MSFPSTVVAQRATASPSVASRPRATYDAVRMLKRPSNRTILSTFMIRQVRAFYFHFEIRQLVIQFVPVLVMDLFIGLQRSLQMLLHQPTVVAGFFSGSQANAEVSVGPVKPRTWLPTSDNLAAIATSAFSIGPITGGTGVIHPTILSHARAT